MYLDEKAKREGEGEGGGEEKAGEWRSVGS